MLIVLDLSPHSELGKVLPSRLGESLGRNNILIYNNIEELESRIRKSIYDIDILLAYIYFKKDLYGLIDLRELILNIYKLIVFEGQESFDISLVYTLHPRFVGFSDLGLSSALQIVEKRMLEDTV